MRLEEFGLAEAAIWEAFPKGESVDLSGWKDASVRASVLRALLLDAQSVQAGEMPSLCVFGARITGSLELSGTDIRYLIRLEKCHFEERIVIRGSRLRQVDLATSSFPGLVASSALIDGDLRLTGCRSSGEIDLAGARITGTLTLNDALLESDEVALRGSRLTVESDILGREGLVCNGQINLRSAEILGSIQLEGASIKAAPGLDAFSAEGISVGAMVNCCDGFTAQGGINLAFAKVHSRICFDDAELASPDGTILTALHLHANELVLRTATPIEGFVELRHARIGVIRDDPRTWPTLIAQDGLVYDVLDPELPAAARLGWLERDVAGLLPHAYEQLAVTYRRLGLDVDARTVLLAKQRSRRKSLPLYGRVWGYLQDWIVGYGYRPVRAAGWLSLAFVLGATFFVLNNPPARRGRKGA
ncbi:hypothetical protein ABT294_10715 [Nonomuraea sp. NPDC000554]|uniref:hypothetical protein n=1 Tax=Nonomuraea sp. NPDC000554 TaxID=3154259 RepID=UPI00332FD18A